MAISAVLGAEQVVQLPKGPVAYRECGEGVPILFVHGGLANADLWRDVVPTLHRRGCYRLISPDWPMGSHRLPMAPGADITPPGIVRIIVDSSTRSASTGSWWSPTMLGERSARCSPQPIRSGSTGWC